MATIVYRSAPVTPKKEILDVGVPNIQQELGVIEHLCSPENDLQHAMIFACLLIYNVPNIRALIIELKNEHSEIFKEFDSWNFNGMLLILKVVKKGQQFELSYLRSVLEYKQALFCFKDRETKYFEDNPASKLDRAMAGQFGSDLDFQSMVNAHRLKEIEQKEPGAQAYIDAILKYQKSIEKFKEAEAKYFRKHPPSASDRSMMSFRYKLAPELKLFLDSFKK